MHAAQSLTAIPSTLFPPSHSTIISQLVRKELRSRLLFLRVSFSKSISRTFVLHSILGTFSTLLCIPLQPLTATTVDVSLVVVLFSVTYICASLVADDGSRFLILPPFPCPPNGPLFFYCFVFCLARCCYSLNEKPKSSHVACETTIQSINYMHA